MVSSLRIRNIIIPVLFYIASTAIVCFFAYSAYHGSRGIMAKRDYKIKIVTLQKKLDVLKTERMHWQVRVNLVRSSALDPDILEERARLILNSAHKNDVMILFDAFK
jgi:cell division protein FtsB